MFLHKLCMEQIVGWMLVQDDVTVSDIFSICNARFKCFRIHVSHFDYQLNSHRIVHRAIVAISSSDFGILKNKRSNFEFASKGDLHPLIQWSPSLAYFHQKIIHSTFTSGDVIWQQVGLFRKSQRHSITLWWLKEYAKAQWKFSTGNWDTEKKPMYWCGS